MDTTEYYKHLSRVQNHNKVSCADIMTITGFMNINEKIDHLRRYAELISDSKAIKFCDDINFIGNMKNVIQVEFKSYR